MQNLPTFKSSFLNEIVFGVKKRSKAIKNKVAHYSVQKVIEKSECGIYEKLELIIRLRVKQISLRFYFWEDRITWIDIRESSKTGWVFEWNTEGRIGSTDAKVIISAIEQSIDIAASQHKNDLNEKLNSLWELIVLGGPK